MIVYFLLVCLLPPVACFDGEVNCTACEFISNGIGYLPHEYCSNFIQCQILDDGSFIYFVKCCPEGEYWEQAALSCSYYFPSEFCKMGQIPCEYNTTTNMPCPHVAAEDPKQYIMLSPYATLMDCPPNTKWDQEYCTCVDAEREIDCGDQLVHFAFNEGDDALVDSSCNKIPCTPHGNLTVFNNSLCLSGNGTYCEFSYLNNWFVRNPNAKEFTFSLWFYQTQEGRDQDYEGIFGNGDCHQESTIAIQTWFRDFYNDTILFAYLMNTFGYAFYYVDTWTFVTIVYQYPNATYYIDAFQVFEYEIGEVANSQVASTIGMSRKYTCTPMFFHGYIDDVSFHSRALSDDEITALYEAGHSADPVP